MNNHGTFNFGGVERYDANINIHGATVDWIKCVGGKWQVAGTGMERIKGALPILKCRIGAITLANVKLGKDITTTVLASKLLADTKSSLGRIVDPQWAERTISAMYRPVMGLMQPVGFNNVEVTPFGRVYASGMIYHVRPKQDMMGRWVLAPTSVILASELSRPKSIANGAVSTTPIAWFNNINMLKRFKRLKLITGWQVKGLIPDEALNPAAIHMAAPGRLPNGIILISLALANKFQLEAKDGSIVPLRTGDKLAGVINTKELGPVLVKGTALVKPLKGYTMWLSDDVVKGEVEFNELTQLYVQSLALERVSIFRSLSYQLLQFFPELGLRRAKVELYKERVIASWYNPEEDEMVVDKSPSLKSLIEGDCALADYVRLFEYPVTAGDITTWRLNSIGESIAAAGSTKGYEKPIKAKLASMLDGCFNPPSRCAWLVAVPNRLQSRTNNTMTISLPRTVWEELGSPVHVAVVRYPIKGKSSLIKLRARIHDGDGCCHISNLLMGTVWNGDFDGDQLQIIADADVVAVATDALDAYNMAYKAREEAPAPIPLKHMPATLEEAATMLLDMDQMGIATTIRDNLHNNGVDKSHVLAIFEAIVQPAINRKEGSLEESPLDDMKVIAEALGLPVQVVLPAGQDLTIPNRALRILRGKSTLDEAIGYVNSGRFTTLKPHDLLVSILRGIKSGLEEPQVISDTREEYEIYNAGDGDIPFDL